MFVAADNSHWAVAWGFICAVMDKWKRHKANTLSNKL
jgi:hypothetical protein